MVSRGDKKPSAPLRKRKTGIVEALLADPVDISVTKAEKAAIKNLRPHRRSSVVSAIVYDEKPAEGFQKNARPVHHKTVTHTHTASVFPQELSSLTFTTKLRNVIQFILDSLREIIALSKSPSEEIEKSLRELHALSAGVKNELDDEMKRHLSELIEETEAFMHGEKTGLTGVTDYQSAMHYRHYVRIAWLSHCILNNAPGPVFGQQGDGAADFPQNS